MIAALPAISVVEARARVIAANRLRDPAAPSSVDPRAETLAAIEHLGAVQIDSISVIERAHHHILWARVPGYQPEALAALVREERKVFEYWSHAAAFIPMRDFRFSLVRKRRYREGKRHWFRRDRKVHAAVLDRIRAEGPKLAREFEAPKGFRGTGWFDWKPAKRALEQLFWAGELMIVERRGFQKVFDLAERVVPAGTSADLPSEAEYLEHLALTAVRAQGWVTAGEVGYLRRVERKRLERALERLRERGQIARARLEGEGREIFYGPTAEPESAPRSGPLALSPFDPLVIQRRRLRRLFGWDYQLECYVPADQRKHGYFCLPLLGADDRFVGRVDLKAERAERVLRVEAFHPEAGAWPRLKADRRAVLTEALASFAEFNGCEKVRFR